MKTSLSSFRLLMCYNTNEFQRSFKVFSNPYPATIAEDKIVEWE